MNYFYDYLKNQNQEHRFARFMGTYYAISNSAIALASFAGSIVFSAFNFFGVFLGTIITLFVASLIVLRLPNYKPKTNINTAKHLKVASPLQFLKLIRELLKKPQIIRLLILTILMDTMFIVFLDMNTTMMNVAGIKAENISQIVGLVAFVRIFSNYFSGKTEKFMSFKRSHSFLLVLMIISVCASLYNSNILIATISTYLCLYPFFDTSIKTKIEHRLDVNTRATIISIVSLFTSVFVILFNALIGLIAEQSGYFSVPVCIFLLVIVVLFLIRNLMFLYRADAFFRKLVAKIKRIAQK